MATKPSVVTDRSAGRDPTSQGPSAGMAPDMMAEMLFDFLKRRGITAILLGLVFGAICGYGAYFSLPVTYKAMAKVQIAAPEGERAEIFKGTQIERIKSDKVLNDALSRPEAEALPFVQNNPAHLDVLRSWLKCESQPDSQIVDITLTGVDPSEIKVLVNAVMQSYIAQAGTSMNEQTKQEITNYRKEKERLESEITKYREEQKKIANDASHNDPSSLRNELQSVQKEIATIRGVESEIVRKIPRLEDEIKLKRSMDPAIQPAELVAVANDQQMAALQTDLQKYQRAAKDQLSASNQGEDDPQYQQAMRKVDDGKARLAKRREEILQPFREQAKKQQQNDILKLEDELKHVRDDQTFYESKRIPLDRKVQKLTKAATDIDGFTSKILQAEDSLKDIQKKLQMLALQSDAKHITIVDEAQVPRLPSSSSKRLAMIGGAGIGGFGLVMLIFWMLDFRLKLISRPEHVQRMLSVPVIGILPKIPDGKRLPDDSDFAGPRKIQRMWHSMQEAVNSLRITLMFAPDRRGAGLTSLMITSPRDGEGKSTLTANLAVSLARSGVKVVMVEADMYRPTLHSTFKVERVPGLADYLRGDKEIVDVVKSTEYPNLDMVSAGTETQNADTLLNDDRLGKLFDELRMKGYQTILIDSPPVLPVCDSLLLGQHVEQTLLCALCNHSQFYSLRQAQDRLENIGIQVMGVVVSGTPATQKYGYYEYQGYKSAAGTFIPPRQESPAPVDVPKSSASEINGRSMGQSQVGTNGVAKNGASDAKSKTGKSTRKSTQ